MTKVLKLYINPWEDGFKHYLMKLENIKYISVHDYVAYEDKDDWFYAVQYFLEDNRKDDFNGCFVMEEYKTASERDARLDEVMDLINKSE